ncbi:MAG: hypothetical protein V1770_03695 [bacterium]
MPCPICGRVMCDCSPKLRGQSSEEMMATYWEDSRQSRKVIQVPRPFNILFTTPIEWVIKRVKNFKKAADEGIAISVSIEEVKSQEGQMLLCLAEVYEGRIYCPLRPSLSILATDGEVLLKDDDRRGEPKIVLVVDRWHKVVLEEVDGRHYYYAIISK